VPATVVSRGADRYRAGGGLYSFINNLAFSEQKSHDAVVINNLIRVSKARTSDGFVLSAVL
jgi:hypothetical protein